HGAPPFGVGDEVLPGFQHNVLDASARQADELGRRQRDEVRLRARAGPDRGVPEHRPLDEDGGDALERERRHGSRTEARRRHDLVRLRDRSPPRADEPCDLARVDLAVARHERHDRGRVAQEDDRRHDLAERAAAGVGRGLRSPRRRPALLDPRLRAGLAQECRDTLHGLGPLHAALGHPSSTKRTSSKPTACSWSTSALVAGESMGKTISASPPSFVRETAMFAMLRPASPNIEPTRPITPGWSEYRTTTMCRAISRPIPKPQAPPRKSRGSGPIVVPETVTSPPSATSRTSTAFV